MTLSERAGNSVATIDNALKEIYTPTILHQLHHDSLFGSSFNTSFRVDPNDWGFDNIFPAPPKAVEQVWFRDWERSVRREKMGSFAIAVEDEVNKLYEDMRRDINRQIYSVDK